jgi:hypothetical protein
MNKLLSSSLITLALGFSTCSFADVLILKDGQSLAGTLVSRDANGVVFDIAGQKLTFEIDKVAGISFGDAPVAKESNDVNTEITSSSQEKNKSITVPAGTRLVVRTNTSLNSKQHKAGHKFMAKLEADLVVEERVIAPRGSTLYGVISASKQSGRLVGKSTIELTFTDIMLNNQMLPIKTSGVKTLTEATGKNTVSKTARAAAVGGLIDGSSGAKTGAKVGLGLSVLSRGNSVNIPAGTMLELQIAVPFTVK